MYRESVQILYFSLLVSTCVSLHMARDAYYRPLVEHSSSLNGNGINVFDSSNIVNDWLANDAVNIEKSIDDRGSKNSYKALDLEFERMSRSNRVYILKDSKDHTDLDIMYRGSLYSPSSFYFEKNPSPPTSSASTGMFEKNYNETVFHKS